jgi:hypothetical protein
MSGQTVLSPNNRSLGYLKDLSDGRQKAKDANKKTPEISNLEEMPRRTYRTLCWRGPTSCQA